MTMAECYHKRRLENPSYPANLKQWLYMICHLYGDIRRDLEPELFRIDKDILEVRWPDGSFIRINLKQDIIGTVH